MLLFVCLFGIGLPGLELTISLEQVGLKLMEVCLLLPPDCWGPRHVLTYPVILISDRQRHVPLFPAILISDRGPVTVFFACHSFLLESSSPSLKLLIDLH